MVKKSKYRAIKTEVNGVIYDSKKEAEFASLCELWLKCGAISNLQRQVKFIWDEINCISESDKKIRFKRSYICDFTYLNHASGEIMYIDVKGFKTEIYKKKKKIVEHLFSIKITEK